MTIAPIPMLRYATAAAVLKVLGLTQPTRRLYRALGNRYGKARHAGITAVEVERGLWVRRMLERHAAPGRRTGTILELGTGWTHLYGLFLRLFADERLVLFDVQDNRNLAAIHARFEGLLDLLRPAVAADGPEALRRVEERVRRIVTAGTFEELYRSLDATYLIEPSGALDAFAAGSFDAVFSVDVLEHVDRAALPATIREMFRVLRPGGVSLHQVGIDDHLTHYAPGMSSKEYLRYSDRTWRWWFENRIQYFNRVQGPDLWLAFEEAGFRMLVRGQDEDPAALRGLVPDAVYRRLGDAALRGTRVYIVAQRPPEGGTA